ncbi:hypothetical protein ABG067_007298 [Albugo candida]
MGFCGECGSNIPISAEGKFCPECGASVAAASDVNHIVMTQRESTPRASEDGYPSTYALGYSKEDEEERMKIEQHKMEMMRRRQESELQARQAREQMDLYKQEKIKKKSEMEEKRQEYRREAMEATQRREKLQIRAEEANLKAEMLRKEALVAQQELEKMQAQRKRREIAREESRRLREEAQRREANRKRAEEEQRRIIEEQKLAEKLRLEALKLASQKASPPAMSLDCSSCNAVLKPGQKFCLQCGTKCGQNVIPKYDTPTSPPIPISLTTQARKCHACAFTLKENQKFCPSCGASNLLHPKPDAENDAAQPSTTSMPMTSLSCSSCQSPLKPSQKFCLVCGKKVLPGIAVLPTSMGDGLMRQSLSSSTSLEPNPIESSKFCRSCGMECKQSTKFCMKCGFNFIREDQEQMDRNVEASRNRRTMETERERAQRAQMSMLASEAIASQLRNTST